MTITDKFLLAFMCATALWAAGVYSVMIDKIRHNYNLEERR